MKEYKIIKFCLFIILAIKFPTSKSQRIITTIPNLPTNTIARGYHGLILVAEFRSNSASSCSWFFNNGRRIALFTSFISCQNRTELSFIVTCVNQSGIIKTTLSVAYAIESMLPINSYNLGIEIFCDGNTQINPINLAVKDCSANLPLTVNSINALYNATGTFSCANHGSLYHSNGSKPLSNQTTCLATAEWSGSTNLDCRHGIITTIPYLPTNTIARGYAGLVLKTEIAISSSSECLWSISNGRRIVIFTTFIPCGNRTDQSFIVTCVNQSETIKTTLILPTIENMLPSGFNYLGIGIDCYSDVEINVLNLTVKSCSVNFPLMVSSTSAQYNAIGTFSCASYGSLYYSNGSKPLSNQTTCLATAEWSGSENLECWYDAAYQDQPATCDWVKNEIGTCSFYFFSNVEMQIKGIFRQDGKSVGGSLILVCKEMEERCQFVYSTKNVSFDDEGIYQVNINSNLTSYVLRLSMFFSISVHSSYVIETTTSQPSTNQTGLIAGLVIFVVLAIIFAILNLVFFFKMKSLMKQAEEKSNYTSQSQMDLRSRNTNEFITPSSEYANIQESNYEIIGNSQTKPSRKQKNTGKNLNNDHGYANFRT